VFTSSGVGTAAAGLEAAVERLRSAESWEAAAEGLGRTEGLETAAANELDSITAGEAVAAGSSGAAVATAGSATSDAAAVLAATLDGATTSDAGSIAFEWIASASASASSFWMKRAPSASSALTGPVRPWSVRCLALGWAHASAKVVGCERREVDWGEVLLPVCYSCRSGTRAQQGRGEGSTTKYGYRAVWVWMNGGEESRVHSVYGGRDRCRWG
jgi:hypothetical protein